MPVIGRPATASGSSIDPPNEVESALAAINTAHNQVSSEVSLAQASADQKIVQSKKGTMRAQAEVQMLTQLSGRFESGKFDRKWR